MEHYREGASLDAGQFIERLRDGLRRLGRDVVGHLRPAAVSHIVDITVSAVDVAAAGNFDQDGVYLDHFHTGLV